jgi:glycosyltransferase involved in cell wall biosynthesis
VQTTKILLLGPDFRCKGGIASVLSNYLEFSSGSEIDYTFVPVRGEGGRFLKLLQSLRGFFNTFWLLAFGKIQVVHAHPSEYNGFWRYVPFFILSKLFGKRIIFHMHGGTFNEFFEHSNKITKTIIRSVLIGCATIIVLSPFWEKYFISIGVAKTLVVPNSVKIPGVNHYNINAKGITYLGFIEERKGVYDLLRAFSLIPSDQNIILNICGSGEDEKLIDAINDSGQKENIVFHGWVTSEKREEIFKNTALFVLPSYYEALPMSVIEAMAYGIPVVSTPVGSIPEVVTDGLHGLLVNAGDVKGLSDAIDKLMSESEMRHQMSLKCYSKIKDEYSIDKTFEKLTNLYHSITLSQH